MVPFELKLAEAPDATPVAGAETPALLIGKLYEQHYRMIRALCQLLLRDPVDAEDAAQQTFLSAFGSMIGGTVPASPAPWLATIARRECWARSAQRRRRPLTLDETNAPLSAADNPLDEAIRNADLTALWKAINGLPRQQRSVFLMREFSGFSYAEVAQALGASESAIESLLVRARRQLRDGFESAVSAANLLATPVLLLQHRIGRLLSERRAAATGALASAGIPVAAKVGAAVVGAIAVGAAGVGAGVGTASFHHGARTTLASPTQNLAARALAGIGSLERLIGRPTVVEGFSFSTNWYSFAGGGSGAAGGFVLAGTADGGTTASPGDGSPTTAGEVTTSTPLSPDPAPAPPPTEASPAETTPTDPAPTDTVPADTTPVDTTPAGDTLPPGTTPGDTPPPDTIPTDTTAASTSPPDMTPTDASSPDTTP